MPTKGEADALEDVLWAHATPECGMEHARARVTSAGIGIVLFIRAATSDIARAKAQRLMADVVAAAGTCAHGYAVTLHG